MTEVPGSDFENSDDLFYALDAEILALTEIRDTAPDAQIRDYAAGAISAMSWILEGGLAPSKFMCIMVEATGELA